VLAAVGTFDHVKLHAARIPILVTRCIDIDDGLKAVLRINALRIA
jgi:hypothetical protein